MKKLYRIVAILLSCLVFFTPSIYADEQNTVNTDICYAVGKYLVIKYKDTYSPSLCGTTGNGPCNTKQTYCDTYAIADGVPGSKTCIVNVAIAPLGTNGVGTCGVSGNRYSMECAAYDRCKAYTGGSYQMCEAEFDAKESVASAPNCATVDGYWMTTTGTQWLELNQDDPTGTPTDIAGQAYLKETINNVSVPCNSDTVVGTQDSTGLATLTITNDADSVGKGCPQTVVLKVKKTLAQISGTKYINGVSKGSITFNKKLWMQ